KEIKDSNPNQKIDELHNTVRDHHTNLIYTLPNAMHAGTSSLIAYVYSIRCSSGSALSIANTTTRYSHQGQPPAHRDGHHDPPGVPGHARDRLRPVQAEKGRSAQEVFIKSYSSITAFPLFVLNIFVSHQVDNAICISISSFFLSVPVRFTL